MEQLGFFFGATMRSVPTVHFATPAALVHVVELH